MDRKKQCLVLAIVFALNIAAIMFVTGAEAASYKKGSSGEMVSQIQTALKKQGFYNGAVDGTYGSATESAVKAFQKDRGLTADGYLSLEMVRRLRAEAPTT